MKLEGFLSFHLTMVIQRLKPLWNIPLFSSIWNHYILLFTFLLEYSIQYFLQIYNSDLKMIYSTKYSPSVCHCNNILQYPWLYSLYCAWILGNLFYNWKVVLILLIPQPTFRMVMNNPLYLFITIFLFCLFCL